MNPKVGEPPQVGRVTHTTKHQSPSNVHPAGHRKFVQRSTMVCLVSAIEFLPLVPPILDVNLLDEMGHNV
ncbi:polyphosphate kinase 2 family protein [Sesbania bispinosa]|nr:polyphosphate kinase 2 family protein [Sesbania bispinosa]